MKSKENKVIELFFNGPKHWYFEEILKEAKISRPQLAAWLNKFEKEGIIRRIKERRKRPYYMQNFNNASFKNKKKLFALNKFSESGFLDQLYKCEAETIIIFGSFARSDWNYDSDIDVFILGSAEKFDKFKFEKKLKREIQLFHFQNEKEMLKLERDLLPYIASGYIVKGDLSFLKIDLNA